VNVHLCTLMYTPFLSMKHKERNDSYLFLLESIHYHEVSNAFAINIIISELTTKSKSHAIPHNPNSTFFADYKRFLCVKLSAKKPDGRKEWQKGESYGHSE